MKAIMSSCWLFIFKQKAVRLITALRRRYVILCFLTHLKPYSYFKMSTGFMRVVRKAW
jgi:hypothetical protein